jgi:hypothetical protein
MGDSWSARRTGRIPAVPVQRDLWKDRRRVTKMLISNAVQRLEQESETL